MGGAGFAKIVFKCQKKHVWGKLRVSMILFYILAMIGVWGAC
jgi:hypothetical protein